MGELDRELVEMLSRSRMVLGEFYPIVIDFDDEVLAGSHREKAGWIKRIRVDTRDVARKLGVPVEVAKDIIRLHTNIQRKPSKEETAEILLRMAKALEKKGIPKEKIAAELCKYVPYSDRHIRRLLPDEYKQIEHKPRELELRKTEPDICPVTKNVNEHSYHEMESQNLEPELVRVAKNVAPERDFSVSGTVETKAPAKDDVKVIRSVEELKRFLREAPEVTFPDNVVSCPYCGRLLEVDWNARRIRRFSGH